MSQNKKIISGFFVFFAALGCEAKAKSNFAGEVLGDCNKLTHAEWIQRYDEVEDKVIMALEKSPNLSQEEEKDLFEVVFPQDLPKSHPMRNGFISCFEIFHDYQKAINNVQSMSALKRLESCYQEAYKKDPPQILGKYMDCLKKIKY